MSESNKDTVKSKLKEIIDNVEANPSISVLCNTYDAEITELRNRGLSYKEIETALGKVGLVIPWTSIRYHFLKKSKEENIDETVTFSIKGFIEMYSNYIQELLDKGMSLIDVVDKINKDYKLDIKYKTFAKYYNEIKK